MNNSDKEFIKFFSIVSIITDLALLIVLFYLIINR